MLPNMSKYHSSLKAAKYFNNEAKEGQRLHCYSPKARYWSLFYYSKSHGYYMPYESDFQKRVLKTGDWIYTDDKGLGQLDSMKVSYDMNKSYYHRSITSQSIKFLNPKTRIQRLQKRYLLQLKE